MNDQLDSDMDDDDDDNDGVNDSDVFHLNPNENDTDSDGMVLHRMCNSRWWSRITMDWQLSDIDGNNRYRCN